MEQAQYAAFLSYSHRDKRWAAWLHRALESYRVPRHLVGTDAPIGTVPERLRPIFRDRDELAASADLGGRIEAALAASRALIVLCSPAAARSHWTNQEIATFKRLHPDRPILAAIVDGEPYASEIAGREDEEAFPPALRYRLDASGAPTAERAEPIAADFRPESDGRRLGKLKLVAGLLGVGLDGIVRRDAAERHRRLLWLSVGSVAGMALATTLALFAFEQRSEAVRQREQADGLVEFMLTDLRQRLQPVGRLDVLDSVGDRALAYYGAQDLGSLDADALGRRARALLLVGEVADQRGNGERALGSFREAARTTGELLQRDPGNWQRVFDHAQSVYWVGYMAGAQGDAPGQLRAFESYQRLGNRLVELNPADRRSRKEAGFGGINLGKAYRDAGRSEEALATFRRARSQLRQVTPPDREVLLALAETHAHAATILFQTGRNREAVAEREQQLAILSRPPFTPDDKEVAVTIALAKQLLGNAYLASGDLARSRAALTESGALLDGLVALDPTNQDWTLRRAAVRSSLALTQLASHHPAEAREIAGEAAATLARLHRLQPEKEDVANWLLRASTVRLAAGDRAQAEQLRALIAQVRRKGHFDQSVDGRTTLAAALVALGRDQDASDPAKAEPYWREAQALLGKGRVAGTWGDVQRAVIARRLGQAPAAGTAIDLSVAYGGLFARQGP